MRQSIRAAIRQARFHSECLIVTEAAVPMLRPYLPAHIYDELSNKEIWLLFLEELASSEGFSLALSDVAAECDSGVD